MEKTEELAGKLHKTWDNTCQWKWKEEDSVFKVLQGK